MKHRINEAGSDTLGELRDGDQMTMTELLTAFHGRTMETLRENRVTLDCGPNDDQSRTTVALSAHPTAECDTLSELEACASMTSAATRVTLDQHGIEIVGRPPDMSPKQTSVLDDGIQTQAETLEDRKISQGERLIKGIRRLFGLAA